MSGTRNNFLLEGSVVKAIIALSVPIILANTLQTIYQLIDTFWVGRLGVDAVAAVSLSFPIIFFLTSLSMGFTMAGSILIAQYNGKGDKENVALATGQTFALVVSLAVIVAIFGYFISDFLFGLLTDSLSVFEQGTAYLKISFLAMPAMFIYMIFQSALRGVGEVKLPMIVIAITVVINFFIDPLFMYGWKNIPALGVSGVAWATLLTEYFSALIAIIIMFLGKYDFNLKFRDFILQKEWVKNLFKLGLPSSLEMSSRSLGMLLMTFVVSVLGTLAIAAYGIGTRVLGFVIIPAMGFSMSTSTLVGNNLGARQHKRAEDIVKTGMKIAFATLMILGVVIFIFAHQIAHFFLPDEVEAIQESAQFIQMMSLTFGFIGIQMVIIGTLRASGKMIVSMSLAVFHTVSLLCFSSLLAHLLGLKQMGVWLAYPLANLCALLAALYVYRQKKWMNKSLVR